MILWLLLLWMLTAIAPFDRRDWLLENLLVFVYAILLIITYRRFTFSNVSYALFVVFLSLHLVGAHYTYAETPLGFWWKAGSIWSAIITTGLSISLMDSCVSTRFVKFFCVRPVCACIGRIFSRHRGHSRLQCIL